MAFLRCLGNGDRSTVGNQPRRLEADLPELTTATSPTRLSPMTNSMLPLPSLRPNSTGTIPMLAPVGSSRCGKQPTCELAPVPAYPDRSGIRSQGKSGDERRNPMNRFEYKCVCILGLGERTARILNEYGRDGWELVATWPMIALLQATSRSEEASV